MTVKSQGALFPQPRGEQETLSPARRRAGPDRPARRAAALRGGHLLPGARRTRRLDPAGPARAVGRGARRVPARRRWGRGSDTWSACSGPSRTRAGRTARTRSTSTRSRKATPTKADLPEINTPQSLGRMWASSMGLSFAVPPTWTSWLSPPSGGSTSKADPTRRPHPRSWARAPVAFQTRGPARRPPLIRVPLTAADPDEPGVYLAVEVGRATAAASSRSPWSTPSRNRQRDRHRLAVPDPAHRHRARRRRRVFLPIDDPLDEPSR